jgi:hypothetical protein
VTVNCTDAVAVFVLQHYNLMYAYSAMASYFARDNVALLGFAKVNTLAYLVYYTAHSNDHCQACACPV